ncbi:hypothetical protein F1559_003365 [Cyanidiococcus yangmingshanensis]|uniref:LysM domain-containing protein n=1 Tax=Cyanidiococcus yangmingshanensis TaxID=2690220 RepID=A0A7J7IG77_9RHOD|nr:hypothetical protein F1559_003365 [Cyanidiococcus yangmingshanensis]
MWVIFVHDGRGACGYSVRSHVRQLQTINRTLRNWQSRSSATMTLVRSVPRPPGFYVTTQVGDTLSTIAARYGVEVERLWELNNRARQLEFKQGRFPFHFWARQGVADTSTTRGLSLEETLGRPLVPGQRVFVPNESAVQKAKVGKQHESRLRLAQPSTSESTTRSEHAKVRAAPAGTISVQVAGRPRALDGSSTMPAQPLKGVTVPAPMPAHPGSVVGTVGSVDFFLGVFAVLLGFYSARLMLPRPTPEPGSPARPSISVILHKQLVGLVQASLTITVLIGLALSALVERLRAVLVLALHASTTLVRGLLLALRVVGSALLLIWGGVTLVIGAFLGLFQRLAQALVYSTASILLLAWRSAVGLWSAASSRSAAVLEGLAKNRMFLASSGMESPSQAIDAPSSVSPSVSQTDSLFAQLCRFFHGPSDGDYVHCVLRERIQISDAYIRMRFDLPNPDDELALLMGQRLEMRVRKSRQSLWSDIHSSSEPVSATASSDIRPHRLAIATDRHQRGSFDIIVPVSMALREVLQEATGIDAARSGSVSSWITDEQASSHDVSGDLRVLERPQTPDQVMPTSATTDTEFDESFLVALESLVEGHDTVLVRPAPDTELVYRRAMNPSAKTVVVHNVALLASGTGHCLCGTHRRGAPRRPRVGREPNNAHLLQ